MSRRKKNAARRRKKLEKKSLKQSLKMPDNEKPSFRQQLLSTFSGGRTGTQPSVDGHVTELQKRMNLTPMSEGDEWGGYGGYGMPTPATGHASHPGFQGSTSNYSQTAAIGTVVLVDAENKRTGFSFKVTSGWKDWWRVASRFWPIEKDEMFIRADRVGLSYGRVNFNACVYTASEDYLSARWGRKLHYTDRDWLAEHPLSTDGGVPSEYTPICVQALLEPYGMGVSRVRLRRGTLAAGPEMQKFMVSLGCNPFAMVDHQTTNKEAAEKMGITEQYANQIFRFEFHDDALPGSVCCEKGVTPQNGVATGSQGGHARYLAPRDKASNWVVSLQCQPIEMIEYNIPVILPEYIPRRGEARLEMEQVLQPMEDLPVGIKYMGDFYFHEELAEKLEAKRREEEERKNRSVVKVNATVPQTGEGKTVGDVLLSSFRRKDTNTTGVTDERPIQILDAQGNERRSRFNLKHKCVKCSKQRDWSNFANGTEICNQCMDEAFSAWHCPNKSCAVSFKAAMVPEFLKKEVVDGVLTASFVCQRRLCKQQIAVKQTEAATHESLVDLLAYLPLGTAEAFEQEINLFLYNSDLTNFDEWWIRTHPDDAVVVSEDKQAELLLAPPSDSTGAVTQQLEENTNSLSSENVLIH